MTLSQTNATTPGRGNPSHVETPRTTDVPWTDVALVQLAEVGATSLPVVLLANKVWITPSSFAFRDILFNFLLLFPCVVSFCSFLFQMPVGRPGDSGGHCCKLDLIPPTSRSCVGVPGGGGACFLA